jgi:hypothetical protein
VKYTVIFSKTVDAEIAANRKNSVIETLPRQQYRNDRRPVDNNGAFLRDINNDSRHRRSKVQGQGQGMMSNRRTYTVIVVGPRDFENRYPVWQKLYDVKRKLRIGDVMIVKHSGHRRGVDKSASTWCRDQAMNAHLYGNRGASVIEETHPPHWWAPLLFMSKRKSILRYKPMIDSGADEAIAFPIGEAPIIRGSINLLRDAGIKVDVVEEHHPQAGKQPLNTSAFQAIESRRQAQTSQSS